MVLQGPVGHMGQPSIESGSLPDREMDMQAETLQNLPRPSHGWEAKQGTSPCPPLSMSPWAYLRELPRGLRCLSSESQWSPPGANHSPEPGPVLEATADSSSPPQRLLPGEPQDSPPPSRIALPKLSLFQSLPSRCSAPTTARGVLSFRPRIRVSFILTGGFPALLSPPPVHSLHFFLSYIIDHITHVLKILLCVPSAPHTSPTPQPNSCWTFRDRESISSASPAQPSPQSSGAVKLTPRRPQTSPCDSHTHSLGRSGNEFLLDPSPAPCQVLAVILLSAEALLDLLPGWLEGTHGPCSSQGGNAAWSRTAGSLEPLVKVPQNHTVIFSRFWRPCSRTASKLCVGPCSLRRPPGGLPPRVFLASGGGRQSGVFVAGVSITPAPGSVFASPSPCVPICLFSLMKTPVIGAGPT